jgi:hypothetical protein
MKEKIVVKTKEEKNTISKSMKGTHNNPEWKLRNSCQPAVKVRCVELRCVFDSVYAAAKMINTTTGNIAHVLAGRQNTAGGFHWTREC